MLLKPLLFFFRYGGIHVFDFLQHEMGPGGRHTGYALDGAVDALQLIGGGAGYLQHKVIISGQIVAVQDVRVVHDNLREGVMESGMLQADFHQGCDIVTQSLGIHSYRIALDYAGLFHLLDAVQYG